MQRQLFRYSEDCKGVCREGKFIWIELGLQTMHEATAEYIRRGYPLSTYEAAIHALADIDIPYITHVILGLPGETEDDMLATVRYVCGQQAKPFGIKLQLLHVLRGTDLCGIMRQAALKCCHRMNILSLLSNVWK